MRMRLGYLTSLLATAAVLASCDVARQAERRIDAADARAGALAAQARAPGNGLTSPVKVFQAARLGGTAIRRDQNRDLPANLDGHGANSITLTRDEPMSLADLAAAIAQRSGLPVRLVDGASDPVAGCARGGGQQALSAAGTSAAAFQPAPAGAAGSTAQGGAAPLPVYLPGFPAAGGSLPAPAAETMTVDYTGPLSGLLDLIADRFDVYWTYTGSITFARCITRTFSIAHMPGSSSLKALLSGDTSSGSGSTSGSGGVQASGAGNSTDASGQSGAASSQSTTTSANLDYWAELKPTLETLAGPNATIAVSPVGGNVTLVATRRAMSRIEQHIAAENRRLTRQISISVVTLSVTLDDRDALGVSLDTIFRDAGLKLRFAGPTPTLGVEGLGSIGIAYIEPAPANASSAATKFAGTNDYVQALSTASNLAVQKTASVITANGAVVPIFDGRRRDIISGSQAVPVSNVGVITTQSIKTLTEGQTLQVMARTIDPIGIQVYFAQSTRQILKVEKEVSQQSVQQLPTIGEQSGVSFAMVPSGASIIGLGLDETTDATDGRGTASPWNILLGGSISGQKQRRRLITIITLLEIDPFAAPGEVQSAGMRRAG